MSQPELMLLIIPLLPLAAFGINGLAGRWLKEIGGWIAVIAMAMSALLSLILLISAWGDAGALPIRPAPLWTWISVASLDVSIGFHYDQLTAVMCFVVTFVGSLVFLYSIGYMKGDPGFSRFFTYLSLFAFSMLILVMADSFVLMFVGWEGVGLCSYLLIGFYMDAPGASEAGKKAFIVNRIGDFGFLMAMFMIFQRFGTLDIAQVVALAPGVLAFGSAGATAIALLLFLGCTGKSAQIPLFIWLPDAMAGPTPVSALIHAATMVTAGVYLVARTSVLFALSPLAMLVMAIIGAATAFVAGTIALTQRDIKKVLAYSTISQLGFMFLACGVGAFTAGIFHVLTHAFFKGCLFLGAGAVIHAIGGTQDLFQMGGLKKSLRITWITFFIAALAISGFPLTAGFFSKDEILWATFTASADELRLMGMPLLYIMAVVTAVLTAVYSFRVVFLAFHGRSRMPEHHRDRIHAPHWTMHAALIVLAAGSIAAGYLNVPEAMGGHASFHHFLSPVTHEAERIIQAGVAVKPAGHSHGLERTLAVISALLAIGGIVLARRVFLTRWPDAGDAAARRWAFLYQVSSGGWWYDLFCLTVFGLGTRVIAQLSVLFDRYVIDGFLHSIAGLARWVARGIRRCQMGQVQAYALGVLIGANILLLVVLLW